MVRNTLRILSLAGVLVILLSHPALGQQVDDEAIGLKVDLEKVKANGIRKLSGKYVTLFTDLPGEESVEEMPDVFDQAFSQWCEFFGVSPESIKFHSVGFMMRDVKRFDSAGLLPKGLPAFKTGYTYGKKSFWMFDQPGDYMRRHLMIHEGTHAFLFSNFGSNIPAWLNEGLAEYFASHRWSRGKLTTRFTIQNREQAPYWGRTKVLSEGVRNKSAFTLSEVLELENRAFLKVESYAWVWGVCAFLAEHPDYRKRFQKLCRSIGTSRNLNREFDVLFRSDRSLMELEWSAYLSDIDYGISSSATRLKTTPASIRNGSIVEVDSKINWQNSGISVRKGDRIRVRAKGRFVVRRSTGTDSQSVDWKSGPGGVTVDYYRGSPLGSLKFLVVPDQKQQDSRVDFSQSETPDMKGVHTVSKNGVIYLRVNESPKGMFDNDGKILVSIEKL